MINVEQKIGVQGYGEFPKRILQTEWADNPDDFPLFELLPNPVLLRVCDRGNEAKIVENPPKNRGLVVAVGKRGQIMVCFAQGLSESEGFHVAAEGIALNRMGHSNIKTILHGAIFGIQNPETKKTERRIINVYKRPPRDLKVLEDGEALPPFTVLDEGVINPEKFLNSPDFIPQRLMKKLRAQELRIIGGKPSHEIYGI